MKKVLWVFALLPLISPPPALAQDTLRIYPGARIRVTAPECQLREEEGEVVSLDQGMFVARVSGREMECPVEALTRLEVSEGENKVWKASLLGMGIGLVAGAAVGLAATGGETSGMEGLSVAVTATAGTGVGLLFGTMFGFMRDPEDWRTVPLPLAQPTLTLAPDGRFGFGFSIPFKR